MSPTTTPGADKPEVVLTCGVAGSGKTIYAQRLEAQGYVRLSVDEEIWHPFGRYGIDYTPDQYARLSRDAEDVLRHRHSRPRSGATAALTGRGPALPGSEYPAAPTPTRARQRRPQVGTRARQGRAALGRWCAAACGEKSGPIGRSSGKLLS